MRFGTRTPEAPRHVAPASALRFRLVERQRGTSDGVSAGGGGDGAGDALAALGNSRPLPPLPVTSYGGADGCSAPGWFRQSTGRGPHRRDEPEHAVLLRVQLDEDDALPGPDRKLISSALRASPAPAPSRDDGLAAVDHGDATTSAPPARSAARPGCWAPQRLQAEPQAVAVARDGDGVRRHAAWLPRLDAPRDPRIETDGGNRAAS